MGKQLISICIPVLNELANLTELIERLNAVASQELSRYEFEFIFTDNQSDDGTWEFINQLSIKQKNIRAIRFTKILVIKNQYSQTFPLQQVMP